MTTLEFNSTDDVAVKPSNSKISRKALFSSSKSKAANKSRKGAKAKKNRLPPSMLVKQGTQTGLPPRPEGFVKQPTLSAILGKMDARMEAAGIAPGHTEHEHDPVFDCQDEDRFTTPVPGTDGITKVKDRPSTPRYFPKSTQRKELPTTTRKAGATPLLLRGGSRLKNMSHLDSPQPQGSATKDALKGSATKDALNGRPSTPRFISSASKKTGPTSPQLKRVQALGGSSLSIGSSVQHKHLNYFVLNSFDSPKRQHSANGTPTSPVAYVAMSDMSLNASNDEESWSFAEAFMSRGSALAAKPEPGSLPSVAGIQQQCKQTACIKPLARRASPVQPAPAADPSISAMCEETCAVSRLSSEEQLDGFNAPSSPIERPIENRTYTISPGPSFPAPKPPVDNFAVTARTPPTMAQRASTVSPVPSYDAVEELPAAPSPVYGFGDVLLRKSTTPPGERSSKQRRQRPRSANKIGRGPTGRASPHKERPTSANKYTSPLGERSRSATYKPTKRASPLSTKSCQGSDNHSSDIVRRKTGKRDLPQIPQQHQQQNDQRNVQEHPANPVEEATSEPQPEPATETSEKVARKQLKVLPTLRAAPAPAAAAAAKHKDKENKEPIPEQPTTPTAPSSSGRSKAYKVGRGGKASPLASKTANAAAIATKSPSSTKKKPLGIHNTNSPLGTNSSSKNSPVKTSAAPDSPKADRRAIEAAAWTDKEIRKLISEIKQRGVPNDNGQQTIKFGQLFDETADIFEALSGTCKTAKKYKVVAYDAEQLWQGQNTETLITLLKETHDGIKIRPRRTLRNKHGANAKSSGFGRASLSFQNPQCHKCTKTVYPMEFVGASDKAFHKNCFRCTTCSSTLSKNDYCVSADGMFRCSAHHREFELGVCPATTTASPACIHVR